MKLEGNLITAAKDRLVEVARISGPYGIEGWIKAEPFCSQSRLLLHAESIWIKSPRSPKVYTRAECLRAKAYKENTLLLLRGIEDRNAALAARGSILCVPRHLFPILPGNEFYWIDLVGLRVENLAGDALGIVTGLVDNGAHQILRINSHDTTPPAEKSPPELLVPFVKKFIEEVDWAREGKIIVDWEHGW